MRAKRLSRVIYRHRTACRRCGTKWGWPFIQPHVTEVDSGIGATGLFALCRKCWKEVKKQKDIHIMLSWYRKAWLAQWMTYFTWTSVRLAVIKDWERG